MRIPRILVSCSYNIIYIIEYKLNILPMPGRYLKLAEFMISSVHRAWGSFMRFRFIDMNNTKNKNQKQEHQSLQKCQ